MDPVYFRSLDDSPRIPALICVQMAVPLYAADGISCYLLARNPPNRTDDGSDEPLADVARLLLKRLPYCDYLACSAWPGQLLYEKLRSHALRTTAALEAHVAANITSGEPV